MKAERGLIMGEFLNCSLSDVFFFDLEFGLDTPIGGDELVKGGWK